MILSKHWILNCSTRKGMIIRGLYEKAAKGEEAAIMNHFKHYEPDVTAWARMQTYIALGNALSAATILNIGWTPMDGFRAIKLKRFSKTQLN